MANHHPKSNELHPAMPLPHPMRCNTPPCRKHGLHMNHLVVTTCTLPHSTRNRSTSNLPWPAKRGPQRQSAAEHAKNKLTACHWRPLGATHIDPAVEPTRRAADRATCKAHRSTDDLAKSPADGTRRAWCKNSCCASAAGGKTCLGARRLGSKLGSKQPCN